MKLPALLIFSLLLFGCKTEKKAEGAFETDVPERGELSLDSKIFLGNRLFSEKTCITCHDVYSVKKGPSVKKIMAVYKAKDGDIVAFLKGNAKPIVDTTASQIAIMQENIDGFLKKITDEELDAIATYMMHVDELNPD
ncbi:c-type cytochrome [Aequorivita vladivostokensis]|uniref:Cytochrome c552 n=1 Tax=Aequorivita vladivostokensis TaxID=171194 RepID=A0ABR5DGY4_9FLAO|nr:c-type cytochrome [Aequorivita vladivostokensis]KJJ38043.1 cytochrome c552 [Aequorivita vladivostokensis]MAB58024.1 cytochrome C [Aequorivita sp.]MBF30269.1 cytochrome C [Aequorivita sp.]|tara:strand:- start:273542 stop:273955 length:414 start_codon:yes stop_codon:yes gene_type:complete